MKIFFAGATGVLGRRVVPQLIEAGYEVTAIGRSETTRGQLARSGARPNELDLFDAAAVSRAVAGHDVIINLATSIPPISRTFLPGAERYIQESFAPIYPDCGDQWIDESVPPHPARYNRAALDLPAGIYNVSDDEPLTRREYVDALASLLDVPAPRLPPRWIVSFLGSLGETLARSQRISNRKLKAESNWAPRYPSMCSGWQAVLGSING